MNDMVLEEYIDDAALENVTRRVHDLAGWRWHGAALVRKAAAFTRWPLLCAARMAPITKIGFTFGSGYGTTKTSSLRCCPRGDERR